jgi:glycosyltransferase involved in cell wall biosynthesis
MAKDKVLYVLHNHPSVRPGGAEVYALELYKAMRLSDAFEPILLARTGPPMSQSGQNHSGTVFSIVSEDTNECLIYTEAANFDWFYGKPRGKEIFTEHYQRFLQTYEPDVVHFQHTLYLGYDMILQTRRTLPRAGIVYTLHEYIPICHRDGQMLRTRTDELCEESSPRRCHECFPEFSPQAFYMRKRFIQSHLSLVDLFIAPSRFLLERYVEWGIPRAKIRFEDYGRQPARLAASAEPRRPRNRIGFFGQLNPFKGATVLLRALKILADESPRRTVNGYSSSQPDVHTWMHGANLDLQAVNFQENFKALIESVDHHVTFVGSYHGDEISTLMANIDWVVVPSIWWENSPLVIQEAFQHGRPVICSDIGGMAEKVTHDMNGLHFRAGDPMDLARTLRIATSTPGLWERLSAGIPAVPSMSDHMTKLAEIYKGLLRRHKVGEPDSGKPLAGLAVKSC